MKSLLFFLRPHRTFWLALSLVALVVAATAFAALIDYFAAQAAGPAFVLYAWSGIAGLRILVAPLFALAFFLSALFAPNRTARIALFSAAAIETAVFASVATTMLHPPR